MAVLDGDCVRTHFRPQELRELLDVSARSVNDFIEATLTGIAAQVQSEHDELTRSTHAERLEVVGLILDGAPISPERAEAKLGYPLSRAHTAAIIWSDELDGDHSYLDRAADLFCHAVGSTRPLTVVAGAASRWAWVTDADGLDIDTVQAAVDNAPGARIAIGTTANGVEVPAQPPRSAHHPAHLVTATVDPAGRLLCRR